jgi:hypothetical protein
VHDPDLQKGQLEFALHQFAGRIVRFQRLGLKTQYGLVSMAVVPNNLFPSPECKPENWMQECESGGNETQIVDCMLDKYVQSACRCGHRDAAKRRQDVIEQVFRNHKDDLYNDPELNAIESCSSKWGQSSGAHP